MNMLTLKRNKKRRIFSGILLVVALLLTGGGLYILSLVAAPAVILPQMRAIDVAKLEEPKPDQHKLIIPKIGVNIDYGTDGVAALDRGAWWRYPDRGNPTGEGNFIIAAHRFEIMPTPAGTLEKSPFYHIDKVEVGDSIIVDYKGKRYGYKVSELKTVKPTAVEIENESDEGKMTLYSCGLGGERSDRLVVIAEPVGEVTLIQPSPQS